MILGLDLKIRLVITSFHHHFYNTAFSSINLTYLTSTFPLATKKETAVIRSI